MRIESVSPVQANVATMIDIWVDDSCSKLDFGRLERVGCGEIDQEDEGAALKGRVRGALELHLPPKEVVALIEERAACRRIILHCCQFLLDPPHCKLTHFAQGAEICNTSIGLLGLFSVYPLSIL